MRQPLLTATGIRLSAVHYLATTRQSGSANVSENPAGRAKNGHLFDVVPPGIDGAMASAGRIPCPVLKHSG